MDNKKMDYQNQNNAQSVVIPITKTMRDELNKTTCNFSLYFPRMVTWKINNGVIKSDERNIEKLGEQGNRCLRELAVKQLLQKKKEQQNNYIKAMEAAGLKVFPFPVKTTSPFITGLGAGHPTETGMILDRNIGVPYLPASSIKGVLRMACAIELAKRNNKTTIDDNDPTLEFYFGTNDQKSKIQKRGQLMFLDAYPEDNVELLKLDIMNPHYGKYYNGENKQPIETESPLPIKFLTVKEGTKFNFHCVYMPMENKPCDEELIKSMFETAFTTVGFGGKTAIGYGRFESVNKQSSAMQSTESSKPEEKKFEIPKQFEIVITKIKKNIAEGKFHGYTVVNNNFGGYYAKNAKEGTKVLVEIMGKINESEKIINVKYIKIV